MPVGPWAQEKLDCLRKYLSAYTTILSRQRFKGYFYVDAFAGPGTLRVRQARVGTSAQQSLLERNEYDEDEANYLAGSPRVALEIEPQFTHYVFVERNLTRIAQLEELKKEFSSSTAKIFVRNEDCNTYLQKLLQQRSRMWDRWRGIVFLDPFGMHVPWNTIEKIGATGAIEVIINFPVGMAIQRLLRRSGEFTTGQRQRLDSYFGTDEWMDVVYEKRTDMMGERIDKVQASGDVLVRWYRERLKAVFGYVSDAREIQTTSGRPLYYLIFAGPNKIGAQIASHVLKQGARRVR